MGSLTIMMVVQLALLFCTVQAFPRYDDPDEGDMEAFKYYDNLADELETAQNDIGVQLQDYGETEQQKIEVQFVRVNCEKLRSTLKVCDPPKCKSRCIPGICGTTCVKKVWGRCILPRPKFCKCASTIPDPICLVKRARCKASQVAYHAAGCK